MYSLRLYKYRDSYVLYTPTVQLFCSLLHTHTLLVQTHKHDVSAPCPRYIRLDNSSLLHYTGVFLMYLGLFLCHYIKPTGIINQSKEFAEILLKMQRGEFYFEKYVVNLKSELMICKSWDQGNQSLYYYLLFVLYTMHLK